MTKNTKVVRQSDSTHTNIDSARTNANVANTQAVPSNVSLPTLDHLRANDNIEKAVAVRLTELQHLNSIVIPQKIKSQRGGLVEVFVKHRAKWQHEYVLAGNNKERVNYWQAPRCMQVQYCGGPYFLCFGL